MVDGLTLLPSASAAAAVAEEEEEEGEGEGEFVLGEKQAIANLEAGVTRLYPRHVSYAQRLRPRFDECMCALPRTPSPSPYCRCQHVFS